MSKRKKKPEHQPPEWLLLLEIRCAVIQHCAALKAVTMLLAENKKEAAVARLDQAVAAMHAVVRGQCAGMTMECPHCQSKENVVAWVDSGLCSYCGGKLVVPGKDEAG